MVSSLTLKQSLRTSKMWESFPWSVPMPSKYSDTCNWKLKKWLWQFLEVQPPQQPSFEHPWLGAPSAFPAALLRWQARGPDKISLIIFESLVLDWSGTLLGVKLCGKGDQLSLDQKTYGLNIRNTTHGLIWWHPKDTQVYLVKPTCPLQVSTSFLLQASDFTVLYAAKQKSAKKEKKLDIILLMLSCPLIHSSSVGSTMDERTLFGLLWSLASTFNSVVASLSHFFKINLPEVYRLDRCTETHKKSLEEKIGQKPSQQVWNQRKVIPL